MACYTKKTLYKISLLEKKKKNPRQGWGGSGGRFSFTYWHWFGRRTTECWGPSSGPSFSFQTHTLAHKHTWKENNLSTGSVLALSWPLPLQSCFVHAVRCRFSHTSPPAAREGWGCRAPTSGACVSPPGLGAAPSLSPPRTGPSCPRQQTPAGPHKQRISSAHTGASGFRFKLAKLPFSHRGRPALLKLSTKSLQSKVKIIRVLTQVLTFKCFQQD